MTNDANSNIPSRDPEVLTTPEEWRRPSLFRWMAVAAFAVTVWLDEPDTEPSTTASTTNSEPAPAPAEPMTPTDNATPATPAQQ